MTPTTQAGATSAENKTQQPYRYLGLAEKIANSPEVLSIFAAPEWGELSEDGKLWVAGIVRGAIASPAVVPESVRRLSEAATQGDRWAVGDDEKGLCVVRNGNLEEIGEALPWDARFLMAAAEWVRTTIAGSPYPDRRSAPETMLAALDRFTIQASMRDVEPRDDDTWLVIDTATADPDTNWPGELVSEHATRHEARVALMRVVMAAAIADAPPSGRAAEGGDVASQRADILLALEAALVLLGRNEPGDSRAVSDEFVAIASAVAGRMNDEARQILLGIMSGPAPTPPASAGDVDVGDVRVAYRYIEDVVSALGELDPNRLTNEQTERLCTAVENLVIATAPAAPEPAAGWDGWQPISTADCKHGADVLGWGRFRQGGAPFLAIMHWFDAGGDFNGEPGWWTVNALVFEPTHWRPLPPPPSTPTRADAQGR